MPPFAKGAARSRGGISVRRCTNLLWSDLDWRLLFSWVSLTCQSRHLTLVLAEITPAGVWQG